MSFLRRLFGGESKPASGPSFDTVEHAGFAILPAPIAEGGQYRLCAIISQGQGEGRREHRMIRADMFPDAASAAEASIRKARQMIAEQGERLFG